EDEYLLLKIKVHQRSAERLLDVFNKNGGVYIKLGQHISALVYLLPMEYTETMKVLQDRCPATSLADIEQLFITDTGSPLSSHFETFDPKPIGVASLAQVHRATLKQDDSTNNKSKTQQQPRQVAVKIQHPALDDHTPIDIAMCSWIVKVVKRVFPEFEFDWLADELRESLPQELDFIREAGNAARVSFNFKGDLTVRVPRVYWAKRRILVMEFVDGKRVDDVEFLKRNGVDVHQVSDVMTRTFSKMIFFDGFIHCDLHPGNLFVRAVPHKGFRIPVLSRLLGNNPYNFELVILDHGLYRDLSPQLRYDYAQLWHALINFDESKIEEYSYRLFLHDKGRGIRKDGIDHHRLFASMLTGRPWEVLSKRSEGIDTSKPSSLTPSSQKSKSVYALATSRTNTETTMVVSNIQQSRFIIAIAEILAKLPRELLLLLKANDLLRAVDESLGVTSGGNSAIRGMMRRVAVMGWYCAVVIRDEGLRLKKDDAGDGGDSGVLGVWKRYVGDVVRVGVILGWLDLWETWAWLVGERETEESRAVAEAFAMASGVTAKVAAV
ncbi:hypothetical protein HDU76_006340, partial [Blyttiomyces sp. JEL0837]